MCTRLVPSLLRKVFMKNYFVQISLRLVRGNAQTTGLGFTSSIIAPALDHEKNKKL